MGSQNTNMLLAGVPGVPGSRGSACQNLFQEFFYSLLLKNAKLISQEFLRSLQTNMLSAGVFGVPGTQVGA